MWYTGQLTPPSGYWQFCTLNNRRVFSWLNSLQGSFENSSSHFLTLFFYFLSCRAVHCSLLIAHWLDSPARHELAGEARELTDFSWLRSRLALLGFSLRAIISMETETPTWNPFGTAIGTGTVDGGGFRWAMSWRRDLISLSLWASGLTGKCAPCSM